MLNIRNIKLLEYLLKNNGVSSIKELADFLGLGERTIRYDLEKINDYLSGEKLPEIIKESKGKLKLEDMKKIEIFFKKKDGELELIPENRVEYLLIKILFKNHIILTTLMEEMGVSRTTIKNDLKSVKEMLTNYKLKLDLKGNRGLILAGEEEDIRKLQLRVLSEYKKKFSSGKEKIKKILGEYLGEIDKNGIKTFIFYIQKQMEKIISDEAYGVIETYILIAINRIRDNHRLERIPNVKFLEETSEFQVIHKAGSILEANYDLELDLVEILKITDYILGSHTYNFTYSYYENWVEVEIMVKNLIDKFNEKIDVDISSDTKLLEGLINHIKPTIYRIKTGIELQNSIYEEVLDSYPILYNITSEIIEELEGFVGEKFKPDETAFLVIHFKAAIDRNRYRKKDIKNILLVCGLGYGSSKLLAQQIKDIYSINIVDIIPYHMLERYKKNNEIDMIITTLEESVFDAEVPITRVKPILSRQDIHNLDKYALPKYRKKVLLSSLLNLVNSTAEVENEKRLIEGLKEIFEDRLIDDLSKEKLDITDLLKVKNISLNQNAATWEDAIERSGKLLLKNGYIKESYITSMIDVVKEYGSYIIISEGVALPHARCEDNVVDTGMSLMTLREPVIFPGGKKVELLISISSADNKEHLDSLVDLMNLLTDYDFKEKIKKMNTSNEVLKFIYKYKMS